MAIQDEIEILKVKAGFSALEGVPFKWWLAFEEENVEREGLILALLQELAQRNTSIADFYLAYLYSKEDNIQVNLDFMDLAIKKVGERRPLTDEDFKDLTL